MDLRLEYKLSYKLHDCVVVQVLIKDPVPTPSCTSVLDPHITTFDNE